MISDFDSSSIKADRPITPLRSASSSNSVLSLMRDDPDFDSFKRFQDNLVSKLKASADRSLTASIEAPSNVSEVYSVYKELEGSYKAWNLDDMTDQDHKKIEFVDLFLARYKQVCKDRKTVRESDLREYADLLETTCGYQKRNRKMQCFSDILKF